MPFKTLLILLGVGIGVTISAVTALATYLIIDAPIGPKMTLQILLVVLAMGPLIYGFSHLFGGYVSTIFADIQQRLHKISRHDYSPSPIQHRLNEIAQTQKEINRLAATLQAHIEALQKQNREKEQMLLSIAHDFRTPLTVMRGYIEEIEDGLISPNQLPATMSILQKEIDFLSDLIANIVTFLESYQAPSCREEIELKSFLEEEVLPILPNEANEITTLEIAEMWTLWCDPLSLRRVFLNLFSNAFRYANGQAITIGTDGGKIYFQDAGSGIPPEDREKIFQPFYTGDPSRNQAQGGIGLGLGIVQNLLAQNGYDIRVDSSYDEGAKFLITPVD